MFYATNKPRHSTYFCTPSGKQNKAEALFMLGLSVLHLFSYPLKKGCKKLSFFTAPLLFLQYVFLRHKSDVQCSTKILRNLCKRVARFAFCP